MLHFLALTTGTKLRVGIGDGGIHQTDGMKVSGKYNLFINSESVIFNKLFLKQSINEAKTLNY